MFKRPSLGILVLLLILAAIPASAALPLPITTRWAVAAGLIVLFPMGIGQRETGRLAGFIIDGRNKMSLSRLQLVAWTVLIVSAYSTAALWNTYHWAKDPLSIAIPPHIWALMGISMTSFVGSSIVYRTLAARPSA